MLSILALIGGGSISLLLYFGIRALTQTQLSTGSSDNLGVFFNHDLDNICYNLHQNPQYYEIL